MQVTGPDGQGVLIDRERGFGRGRSGLLDPACSAESFILKPVLNVSAQCLHLVNKGANPLIVDVKKPDGSWDLAEFLEKGESTVIGASHRFYLAQRQETSTFSVSVAPKPEAASASLPAHQPSGTMMQPPAFQLLRVRNLAAQANRGILGCHLSDLVTGDLRFALVSNFMVDMPWVVSAMPDLLRAAHHDGLVVAHGERSPEGAAEIRKTLLDGGAPTFWVHAPPLRDRYGVHHSKAFVLAYEHGVRVIVHTANLIYADGNNKSQGIWHQDFPQKVEGSEGTSQFERDLTDYIRALRLPQAASNQLLALCARHDFSAARAHLIVSRPGYHTGENVRRYGHMAVRTHLAKETFDRKFAGAPIVAQFSSMGSLTPKWINEELCRSFSAGRCASASPAAAVSSQLGEPSGAGGAQTLKPQLVWPTEQEVRNSIEGWAAGCSIPGQVKNVMKPFMLPAYHSFGGESAGRQRAMPHIKTYARYRGQELAWVLLGSHNLSRAAWGTLQLNSSQLHILHYELGVLVLPSLEQRYLQSAQNGFCAWPHSRASGPVEVEGPVTLRTMSLGDGRQLDIAAPGPPNICRVPLPYKLPPQRYAAGDVPWAIGTTHEGPDILGTTQNPDGSFNVQMYGHIEGEG